MDLFKSVLYVVSILTCLTCTLLLVRRYRQTRLRLLLWCALCFVGLTVNNIVLFVDLVVFPAIDLRPLRLSAALIGMLFLLYGLVWDGE